MADDEKKFKDCLRLLEIIEKGKIRPYTSNIIILEIIFVLIRIYKFPKKKVLDGIKKILNLRNFTLIETTNAKEAIKIFKSHNVKFPDCLIATQIPEGAKMVTYDQDFQKINGIFTAEPKDF